METPGRPAAPPCPPSLTTRNQDPERSETITETLVGASGFSAGAFGSAAAAEAASKTAVGATATNRCPTSDVSPGGFPRHIPSPIRESNASPYGNAVSMPTAVQSSTVAPLQQREHVLSNSACLSHDKKCQWL